MGAELTKQFTGKLEESGIWESLAGTCTFLRGKATTGERCDVGESSGEGKVFTELQPFTAPLSQQPPCPGDRHNLQTPRCSYRCADRFPS